MYEKVQMWQQHLKDLKNKIEKANSDEKVAIDIYEYLSETDMAVVVSSSNDIAKIDAKAEYQTYLRG